MKLARLLAVGIILSALPIAALGQEHYSNLQRNWILHVGTFVPQNSGARRAVGDFWFDVGAEHPFMQTGRILGTVSIEYYGDSGVYNIPMMLNAITQTKRFRFGVGMGIGLGRQVDGASTSGVAYNVLAGVVLKEAPNPITFDLRYIGMTTANNDLNGLSMTFGFQF